MGDILNTTNTILAIIGEIISIGVTIVGVFAKHKSQAQPQTQPQPQIPGSTLVNPPRVQESGFDLFRKLWGAVFLTAFVTALCTAVADGIISIFSTFFFASQHNGFSSEQIPPFANPTIVTISVIFGVLAGITAGLGSL